MRSFGLKQSTLLFFRQNCKVQAVPAFDVESGGSALVAAPGTYHGLLARPAGNLAGALVLAAGSQRENYPRNTRKDAKVRECFSCYFAYLAGQFTFAKAGKQKGTKNAKRIGRKKTQEWIPGDVRRLEKGGRSMDWRFRYLWRRAGDSSQLRSRWLRRSVRNHYPQRAESAP